ncbi:unnamed protein product, partial [Notodromas monacha]
ILGLVDYDCVEINNLHRQVLHDEEKVGMNKALSIAASLKKQVLNSLIETRTHEILLNKDNAMGVISTYDIVVDCSDNVPTRYLLNDACVLLNKPLVSGSALRYDGQLTVYHSDGGPCYRCIFPKPPPPYTVANCSDGGVLGMVPGIIGTLQALEVVKLLTKTGDTLRGKLMIFDGASSSFRKIKLRERREDCSVCGRCPTITELQDYELLCGASANDKDADVDLLDEFDRVEVKEYKRIVDVSSPHILLDVRPKAEVSICVIPGSINLPFNSLTRQVCDESYVGQISERCVECNSSPDQPLPVFVVCRRGNDSQIVVETLKKTLEQLPVVVKDLKGGLHAWASDVDPEFPVY